jgi:amino acid permease
MGLFMRTGVMITLCGGAGTIIAYCIAGMIITCVMLCLSEMVSFKHSPGVIFDFPSKFVSPALGFAVGVIYWLVEVFPAESSLTLFRLSYTTSIITLTAAATELLEFSAGTEEIGSATYSYSGRVYSVIIMIAIIFVISFLNLVGGVKVRRIMFTFRASANLSRYMEGLNGFPNGASCCLCSAYGSS